MPTGYALKKFGESNVLGPIFDSMAREKLKKLAGTPAEENP
jgi:hypothetical protein